MPKKIVIVETNEITLLKQALAINLSKKLPQTKVSKLLNITQPMISNYIVSKKNIPKHIELKAQKIENKILNGGNLNFYSFVVSEKLDTTQNHFVANSNELLTNPKQSIMDNITKAFMILKDKKISAILPKIKMNIALTSLTNFDEENIGSLSNGFLIINDRISIPSEIVFGKSKHLSSLLLYLKKKNNDINAIMNIKYIGNVDIENKMITLSKNYNIKTFPHADSIIIHKGDFGIEPCSYIVGQNATDVAKKIIKINQMIKK